MKLCQDVLEEKVTNSKIYRTQQTMFRHYIFTHALKGACKADILYCKSEDDEGKIVVCVATVQKILFTCVIWTNKSSLGSRAQTKAQKYVGLKPLKMLTPIKTRWAYFISTLQCMIESRVSIDYICGPMAGVGANIKKRLPNWMDWEVAIRVVQNMKNIVNYIKLNQAKVEKWMLSQSTEELLDMYISMSKGMVPKVAQKQIEELYLRNGEDDQEVCHFVQHLKTHVWKYLKACVYICFHSCDVFWISRRKRRIYTFLFFWIHVITG